MPELPEVETTRRGIEPHIKGQKVVAVTVRERRLRWPIPEDLETLLTGAKVITVKRRAKYLLIGTERGTLTAHLGMSGSMRIVDDKTPIQKHDHVDITFNNGSILRFNDPRRFGAMLWVDDVDNHELIRHLGPEPLEEHFTPDYFYHALKLRKQSIKTAIMDNRIVVGVGNIYANESLFLSGIHPARAANRISRQRLDVLHQHIQDVLAAAIAQGGTTLRDFVGGDGKPGYFKQQLFVYGRGGEPCKICGTLLKEKRLGQRSTVYCPLCQR